mmetsp:Transcript_20030/g.17706  ORF Transcript_20030/g.17706 Transcript_20030/m.17706 type:complete len:439 (+) Transcript_20030:12-1328(+)
MKVGISSILILLLITSAATAKVYDGFYKDLSLGGWRVLTALFDDLWNKTPEMVDDAYKSDSEYYQSYGFRFEEHKIITEDGYILSAHRLPGKQSDKIKDLIGRPPVMLQHGLLDNSATFTIGAFNRSLPYLLSEAGYDVWMTNTRGNFNSYEHSNPKDYSVFDQHSKYWNFTFDQMAIYDLPANIDYILDYTNHEKLTYIGHSQGTIQFWAANSMGNIANKIEAFVGLGPVMYIKNMRSPIMAILKLSGINNLFKYMDWNNLLIWPKIVNVELKSIVKYFRKTVWRFVQLIVGVEPEIMIDLDRMPVMGRHEPGGTSLNNMLHWLQMSNSGLFQRMDYGEEENIKVYGQAIAPLFDQENLKKNLKDLDMFLIRGDIDVFVEENDFQKLIDIFADKIGTTLQYKVIPKYGHLDYIWAHSSYEEVALPVLDFLKNRRTST